LLCVTIGSYSVAYAEYVLMEPSQAYHSIMATVHEKIYLSKVRPGDTWSLLFSAAQSSPRAREMVWAFVKEKWSLLQERFKAAFLLPRIVDVSVTTVFVSESLVHWSR